MFPLHPDSTAPDLFNFVLFLVNILDFTTGPDRVQLYLSVDPQMKSTLRSNSLIAAQNKYIHATFLSLKSEYFIKFAKISCL